MAAIVDLTTLLPFAHINLWLAGDDFGAMGMDGDEVIVAVENRHWVGRVELPPLTTAQALAARAAGDRMRGRRNHIRVPIRNVGVVTMADGLAAWQAGMGLTAAILSAGELTHSDGAVHSDGAGYALPTSEPPTVAADAAQGESRVQMDSDTGRNLAVGAFFSIGDFLYRVAENADGLISFNPPLRRDVLAGEAVEVDRPTVLVRLARADGWRVVQEHGRHARATAVDVVEVIRHA